MWTFNEPDFRTSKHKKNKLWMGWHAVEINHSEQRNFSLVYGHTPARPDYYKIVFELILLLL